MFLDKTKSVLSAAVAAVGFLAVGTAAWAQDLNPGISCLDGDVPALDWSELTSKYKESLWDTKAAMRIHSDGNPLQLTVTDTAGASVCDEDVNDRARCKFRFSASYSGLFNIRIDNLQNNVTTSYRLCAE